MRRRWATSAAVAILATVGLAGTASGQAGDRAEVDANGNAFTGGLSFTPAQVSVRVGGAVTWTNTDFLVPHTSTEDHGLWDLSGNYAATPLTTGGYGPGATVVRVFEAGTHRYYCKVHPTQMRATVEVPVDVVATRRRVRRRVRGRVRSRLVTTIGVRWAAAAPADGLVFDVERRRGDGEWSALRSGTTDTEARFAGGRRGTRWELRARLRSAEAPGRATDWSPAVPVTA